MQTNWIGRSEGAEVSFPLEAEIGEEDRITVFTTRPDTLFGVTFMVIAPEHPLVEALTTAEQREAVEQYAAGARLHTEIDRQSTEREKTGVFTGSCVRHPLTDQRVPIWVADYVLLSYGTGAVMGVPAHDERDFAFASKYGLEVPVVIAPPGWDGEPLEAEAYAGHGTMVNSGEFDGTPSEEGKAAVAAALEARGLGKPGGLVPDPRLADLAAALLGRADSDDPLRRMRDRAGAGVGAAGAAAGRRGVPAGRRLAAGAAPGIPARALPALRQGCEARDGPRWIRSCVPIGTCIDTSIRATTTRRSAPGWRNAGCRSISTPAAPSTR